MKVVCTSDFHGVDPPEIPPCDLLIVAGDCIDGYLHRWPASMQGIHKLRNWLDTVPAETIVAIAGNHDFHALTDNTTVRSLPWIYLEDQGCVVDGVKVWGSPWSLPFGDWAFMAPEDRLAEKWAMIPDDTQILIVHGPAHGINDRVSYGRNVGSILLRQRLRELHDLQLLVTGHIHEAYGDTHVVFPDANSDRRYVRCVNPSLLDGHYRKRNPPIVIDLQPHTTTEGSTTPCLQQSQPSQT